MTDPNQPYRPEAYPRMLYATAHVSRIVENAADEAAARKQGFGDFSEIDATNDGLETLPREHLYDQVIFLARQRLAGMTDGEIIELIRAWREEAAQNAAQSAAEPDIASDETEQPSGNLDSLDDVQLRAMIEQRSGTKPHHFTKRPKLLALVRAPFEPAE